MPENHVSNTHVPEDTYMNDVEKRLTDLGQDMNKTIYRLSGADVACLISDNIEQRVFEQLTDEQVLHLTQQIEKALSGIEWTEYGSVGISLWEHEEGIDKTTD